MKIILNESIYKKLKGSLIVESIPLSSFKIQDTLCPDIFDDRNKMLPEVRKVLLTTGKKFYESLGTDWVDLEDIILTGSLANYNWSKFSDVDLHIVIPYKKISKNPELVDEFVWVKKDHWNKEHDTHIENYEVELYAQDTEGRIVSEGIYSVLFNKWIKFPQKKDIQLNKDAINTLVDSMEDKIKDLIDKFMAGKCFGLMDEIDELKSEMSSNRKRGLEKGGEYSPENIAFKAIRRAGSLDKLDDIKEELFDGSLSTGEMKDSSNIIRKDKPLDRKKDDISKDGGKVGDGRYMIQGRQFISLRRAERILGIPKSTIQYRVKSDNPEYNDYKELKNT